MEISKIMIEKLKHLKGVKILHRFFSTYIANIVVLGKELRDCESILDLGCGSHSTTSACVHLPKKAYLVGVDIFKPYILKSKQDGIHDDYILGDIRKLGIKPRSFDAVIALNVLEHLKKEDGFKLMEDMEYWAKKKVIISTPNGPQYQEPYDGNPFQKHQSSYFVEDFTRRGYRVRGIGGLSCLKRREKGGPLIRPNLLLTIISDLTRKLTYYIPKLDYQLFCVKERRALR